MYTKGQIRDIFSNVENCGIPDFPEYIHNVVIYHHAAYPSPDAVETPVELWLKPIEHFIAEHQEWNIANIYTDYGNERTGYEQMIRDCRDGEIQLVITKNASRFSRNIVEAIEKIRTIKELGSGVYIFNENILL